MSLSDGLSRLYLLAFLHSRSSNGVTLKSGLVVKVIENGTVHSLGAVSYWHSMVVF